MDLNRVKQSSYNHTTVSSAYGDHGFCDFLPNDFFLCLLCGFEQPLSSVIKNISQRDRQLLQSVNISPDDSIQTVVLQLREKINESRRMLPELTEDLIGLKQLKIEYDEFGTRLIALIQRLVKTIQLPALPEIDTNCIIYRV